MTTRERPRRHILYRLLRLVLIAMLVPVTAILIQQHVGTQAMVLQTSMQATLDPGDHVWIDKLSTAWSPLSPGEVVVFPSPAGTEVAGELLVKRILAVAGETVDISADNRLLIDGMPVYEAYVLSENGTGPMDKDGTRHWKVPEGMIFVLGDHRDSSLDSRVFGPVPASAVVGRVAARIWPLNKIKIIYAAQAEAMP
jgi:signal peptidase I